MSILHTEGFEGIYSPRDTYSTLIDNNLEAVDTYSLGTAVSDDGKGRKLVSGVTQSPSTTTQSYYQNFGVPRGNGFRMKADCKFNSRRFSSYNSISTITLVDNGKYYWISSWYENENEVEKYRGIVLCEGRDLNNVEKVYKPSKAWTVDAATGDINNIDSFVLYNDEDESVYVIHDRELYKVNGDSLDLVDTNYKEIIPLNRATRPRKTVNYFDNYIHLTYGNEYTFIIDKSNMSIVGLHLGAQVEKINDTTGIMVMANTGDMYEITQEGVATKKITRHGVEDLTLSDDVDPVNKGLDPIVIAFEVNYSALDDGRLVIFTRYNRKYLTRTSRGCTIGRLVILDITKPFGEQYTELDMTWAEALFPVGSYNAMEYFKVTPDGKKAVMLSSPINSGYSATTINIHQCNDFSLEDINSSVFISVPTHAAIGVNAANTNNIRYNYRHYIFNTNEDCSKSLITMMGSSANVADSYNNTLTYVIDYTDNTIKETFTQFRNTLVTYSTNKDFSKVCVMSSNGVRLSTNGIGGPFTRPTNGVFGLAAMGSKGSLSNSYGTTVYYSENKNSFFFINTRRISSTTGAAGNSPFFVDVDVGSSRCYVHYDSISRNGGICDKIEETPTGLKLYYATNQAIIPLEIFNENGIRLTNPQLASTIRASDTCITYGSSYNQWMPESTTTKNTLETNPYVTVGGIDYFIIPNNYQVMLNNENKVSDLNLFMAGYIKKSNYMFWGVSHLTFDDIIHIKDANLRYSSTYQWAKLDTKSGKIVCSLNDRNNIVVYNSDYTIDSETDLTTSDVIHNSTPFTNYGIYKYMGDLYLYVYHHMHLERVFYKIIVKDKHIELEPTDISRDINENGSVDNQTYIPFPVQSNDSLVMWKPNEYTVHHLLNGKVETLANNNVSSGTYTSVTYGTFGFAINADTGWIGLQRGQDNPTSSIFNYLYLYKNAKDNNITNGVGIDANSRAGMNTTYNMQNRQITANKKHEVVFDIFRNNNNDFDMVTYLDGVEHSYTYDVLETMNSYYDGMLYCDNSGTFTINNYTKLKDCKQFVFATMKKGKMSPIVIDFGDDDNIRSYKADIDALTTNVYNGSMANFVMKKDYTTFLLSTAINVNSKHRNFLRYKDGKFKFIKINDVDSIVQVVGNDIAQYALVQGEDDFNQEVIYRSTDWFDTYEVYHTHAYTTTPNNNTRIKICTMGSETGDLFVYSSLGNYIAKGDNVTFDIPMLLNAYTVSVNAVKVIDNVLYIITGGNKLEALSDYDTYGVDGKQPTTDDFKIIFTPGSYLGYIHKYDTNHLFVSAYSLVHIVNIHDGTKKSKAARFTSASTYNTNHVYKDGYVYSTTPDAGRRPLVSSYIRFDDNALDYKYPFDNFICSVAVINAPNNLFNEIDNIVVNDYHGEKFNKVLGDVAFIEGKFNNAESLDWKPNKGTLLDSVSMLPTGFNSKSFVYTNNEGNLKISNLSVSDAEYNRHLKTNFSMGYGRSLPLSTNIVFNVTKDGNKIGEISRTPKMIGKNYNTGTMTLLHESTTVEDLNNITITIEHEKK